MAVGVVGAVVVRALADRPAVGFGVSVLLGFGCSRVTGTATESRETT
ncbi:MAG TPA: hypothetical protein VK287_00920 [Gaiellaceae bacterium]|nr:hypothetical protein [Gaiellaceae bacterium]